MPDNPSDASPSDPSAAMSPSPYDLAVEELRLLRAELKRRDEEDRTWKDQIVQELSGIHKEVAEIRQGVDHGTGVLDRMYHDAS
jgi:hypothetical protein